MKMIAALVASNICRGILRSRIPLATWPRYLQIQARKPETTVLEGLMLDTLSASVFWGPVYI